MAGIDNITGRILKDAQAEADGILAKANAKAEKILRKAQEEAAETSKAAASKREREVKTYEARIASSCDIAGKKAVLAARQDLIEKVTEQAYKKLNEQDTASYFDLMRNILEKSVRPESGVISFSEKDLARMPESFRAEAGKIASRAGGSLSFDNTPAPIESGFILSYGGIEENCSLRSIFAANKDQIQDTAMKVLFS